MPEYRWYIQPRNPQTNEMVTKELLGPDEKLLTVQGVENLAEVTWSFARALVQHSKGASWLSFRLFRRKGGGKIEEWLWSRDTGEVRPSPKVAQVARELEERFGPEAGRA